VKEVVAQKLPSKSLAILDTDYRPSIDLTGCHVLITDDDLVNQMILTQVLRRIFKADCDVATNGCVRNHAAGFCFAFNFSSHGL